MPTAWAGLVEFPDLDRRVRIGYIEEMHKNSVEFARRLQHFFNKTDNSKMNLNY
jgi:hypothetical protein